VRGSIASLPSNALLEEGQGGDEPVDFMQILPSSQGGFSPLQVKLWLLREQ